MKNKYQCSNCLMEFMDYEYSCIQDTNGNVFCSRDCKLEFIRNLNEELKSDGE